MNQQPVQPVQRHSEPEIPQTPSPSYDTVDKSTPQVTAPQINQQQIILRLMDRVVQFTIRCAHFPQRVHGNLRGFDILVVIIDMHGHLSLQLMDRVVWNVLSGGPQIKSKSVEKQ